MASNSGIGSSSSSESSRESSLALSYDCSSFGSGDHMMCCKEITEMVNKITSGD